MIRIGSNNNLSSLLAYGGCEQNGTPTPDSPVDIICNNGTLKFVSDDVPIDYLRLEYLESSGTQYIDSGISINYATEKIEQTATLQYTKSNTDRELMGANGYGFFGKSVSNKLESAIGTTSTQITESALSKNTVSLITNPSDKSVIFNINSHQYKVSASTLADNHYTCFVFALGGRDGAAASFFCNVKVYDYKIILNDEVVLHLIPVKRRSDGVLGMYDTVSGTFKTNAGTGTFTAGKVIGHVDAIGTPEVITVGGENLLDPSEVSDSNQYIHYTTGNPNAPSASGGIFRHSGYIPVKEGVTYFFGITPFTASVAGIAWYTNTTSNGYIGGMSGSTLRNDSHKMKAAAPARTKYLRFCWRIDEGYDTDWENSVFLCRCVDGEPVISTWEPYVTPQIITVENLLSIGDDKDEQETISGVVTRKCGIKALDGTEEWITDTYGGYRRFVNYNFAKTQLSVVLCTHFESISDDGAMIAPSNTYVATTGALVIYKAENQATETVEDWKSYLATQYTNGNPVIVVYLLEEDITEQVTAQPVTERTATIIQSSINGLEIQTKEQNELIKRYITDDNGTPQEVIKVYIGNDIVWER